MAVLHYLAGLGPRAGEPEPEDDVVESTLQHSEQVNAGQTLLPLSLTEITTELVLVDAIDTARLLLRP
jgi:hypothetical protein